MRRSSLILAAFLALVWTPAGAGVVLQSHRAVYELTLASARPGSSIANLSGRLVMEWGADCEGYILNQRMVTEVSDMEGERATNDFQVTSWESLDGLKFRFSSRDSVAGDVTDELDGKAELKGAGAAGLVRFRKPQETAEVKLPSGTVFPTEQAIRLVEAALRGDRTASMLLYDGSRVASLYETFSVIGKPYPAMSAEEAGDNKLLAGQKSWPVHIAYFAREPETDRPPGTPDFQIGYRLFENGIATEIELDYGDFVLDGKLSKLEALPRPSC